MPIFEHDGQRFHVDAESIRDGDGKVVCWIPFCSGPITLQPGYLNKLEEGATYGFIPGRRFQEYDPAIAFAIAYVRQRYDDQKSNRGLKSGDYIVRIEDQRTGKIIPPEAGQPVELVKVYVLMDDDSLEHVLRTSLLRLPEIETHNE